MVRFGEDGVLAVLCEGRGQDEGCHFARLVAPLHHIHLQANRMRVACLTDACHVMCTLLCTSSLSSFCRHAVGIGQPAQTRASGNEVFVRGAAVSCIESWRFAKTAA